MCRLIIGVGFTLIKYTFSACDVIPREEIGLKESSQETLLIYTTPYKQKIKYFIIMLHKANNVKANSNCS